MYALGADNVRLPVELEYSVSLLTFVVSSHYVILADGHGLDTVLLSQLFGKRGRHKFPANVGRCTEMPGMVLAPVRSHKRIELHLVAVGRPKLACCSSSDGSKGEEMNGFLIFVEIGRAHV